MTQALIRAYTAQRTLEFIDHHFDAATSERVKAAIPDEVLQEVSNLSAVDWCPISYTVSVLEAIGSAKSAPEESYRDLVACGKFVSTEAANTFYKLLLKVVTPPIFFRKIESFWSRDFSGAGTWDKHLDDTKNEAELQLSGVEGISHLAPVTEGFLRNIMEAMGYTSTSIETKGWSPEQPAPDRIQFHITWE